ncbi:hypothetical protein DACRYDRAFT_112054 [Dacryopinax primogenitus]|uniref:Uncharacterized protein n=1 Tax=Dacryopinax primogenitus (strain DJM 731) TaxID=1858805 RepID=M5FZZ7_DACPD|nr:uncharacterized protein DACRYDRAFT_112054 [Dacryopinax primogenitus]EJT97092.1 hypothetical protein DACRYDRAFT_112054 [Dacryopinax primogenitus]
MSSAQQTPAYDMTGEDTHLDFHQRLDAAAVDSVLRSSTPRTSSTQTARHSHEEQGKPNRAKLKAGVIDLTASDAEEDVQQVAVKVEPVDSNASQDPMAALSERFETMMDESLSKTWLVLQLQRQLKDSRAETVRLREENDRLRQALRNLVEPVTGSAPSHP